MVVEVAADPIGLRRVIEPRGALPQAAWRLDASPEVTADEVRIKVERLNLDAASFRQLREKHAGDGDAIRTELLDIVHMRGKVHNPVTGSGGMLIGVVDAVAPDSTAGLEIGDRVATLVSLTLTPLIIEDALVDWDGSHEQVPCRGHAILFGSSTAVVLPGDLPSELSLSIFDVCGAPALTARVVEQYDAPTVAVIGGGGKSGSLSLAAARRSGASHLIGVEHSITAAASLKAAHVADTVVIADARNPVALREAVLEAGGPAQVTVVCVDVPGCEGGAILSTAGGGTIIFFSMATSFAAAALGAEGLGTDITMLIGSGHVTGHAELALDLVRNTPGLRDLFEGKSHE